MTNTVFPTAEHWDLPNTEIFLSKDVASGFPLKMKPFSFFLDKFRLEFSENLILKTVESGDLTFRQGHVNEFATNH
jgi:hypothetical protein